LEGIFYVLRTGIQWKALPKEYGVASSIHQYFSEWAQADVEPMILNRVGMAKRSMGR
jgi:transposase